MPVGEFTFLIHVVSYFPQIVKYFCMFKIISSEDTVCYLAAVFGSSASSLPTGRELADEPNVTAEAAICRSVRN